MVKNNNLLNKLYNNAKHILYVADIDTYEVLFTNEYTKKTIGDIVGKKCYEEIHGKAKPCDLCPNKRLIDKHRRPLRPFKWDYYNEKLKRWFDAHVEAVEWNDGRIVRYEIAHDITDRKRDEKSLMQIIKNQQLLSEIPQIFSLIKDFDDRVEQALHLLNERMLLKYSFIIEYNKDCLVQNSLSAQKTKMNGLTLIDNFKNYSVEFNKDFLATLKKNISIENRNSACLPESIRVDLRHNHVEKYLFLPLLLDDEMYGFLFLWDEKVNDQWHDIEFEIFQSAANIISLNYRRRTNQETIIISERNLRIANATKDKFFKIIAHDLKNPFNTILGFAELLLSRINTLSHEKQLRYIRTISGAAKSAYSLLENLLLWARSQDGTILFNPIEISLSAMIEEITELLKPAAQKKNIEIISEIPEGIIVIADDMMLSTVIRNLVSNAIKFTLPDGDIKVACVPVKEGYQFSVKDTGIGISDEEIVRLFRIESHHTTVGTENEAGTGLGLVLCKEFIEKHGGRIWVNSQQGEGSTFHFIIPANLP